jgi:hypothetical protein
VLIIPRSRPNGRIAGPHFRDRDQDEQQQRHDRDARGDREVEQRRLPLIDHVVSHGSRVPER